MSFKIYFNLFYVYDFLIRDINTTKRCTKNKNILVLTKKTQNIIILLVILQQYVHKCYTFTLKNIQNEKNTRFFMLFDNYSP